MWQFSEHSWVLALFLDWIITIGNSFRELQRRFAKNGTCSPDSTMCTSLFASLTLPMINTFICSSFYVHPKHHNNTIIIPYMFPCILIKFPLLTYPQPLHNCTWIYKPSHLNYHGDFSAFLVKIYPGYQRFFSLASRRDRPEADAPSGWLVSSRLSYLLLISPASCDSQQRRQERRLGTSQPERRITIETWNRKPCKKSLWHPGQGSQNGAIYNNL